MISAPKLFKFWGAYHKVEGYLLIMSLDYAKYFIGNSYLKPLTDPKQTVFMANVNFEE